MWTLRGEENSGQGNQWSVYEINVNVEEAEYVSHSQWVWKSQNAHQRFQNPTCPIKSDQELRVEEMGQHISEADAAEGAFCNLLRHKI